MKLYVGNLAWSVEEEDLKQAFDNFGEITFCRVITDRESGRSRGFGFVEFSNNSSGESAIQEMDGQEIQGRSIRVNEARSREEHGYRKNEKNKNYSNPKDEKT